MKLFRNTIKHSEYTDLLLIELLVVIGVLAILLAITLIAINPNKLSISKTYETRSGHRMWKRFLTPSMNTEAANNGQQPPSVSTVTTTPVDLGLSPGPPSTSVRT